jgi:hypothetical protein
MPLPQGVHVLWKIGEYSIEIEYVQKDVDGDVIDCRATCTTPHCTSTSQPVVQGGEEEILPRRHASPDDPLRTAGHSPISKAPEGPSGMTNKPSSQSAAKIVDCYWPEDKCFGRVRVATSQTPWQRGREIVRTWTHGIEVRTQAARCFSGVFGL